MKTGRMSDVPGFFEEVSQGRHDPSSEDRLTHIFVACFNASPAFRKAFFRLVGVRKGATEAVAWSHIAEHVPARRSRRGRNLKPHDRGHKIIPDIRILSSQSGTELITVECKTASALTEEQLRDYSRPHRGTDSPLLVAVVNRIPYRIVSADIENVHRWSDLYAELERGRRGLSDADRFVRTAFLQHLEALGMERITHISRAELTVFAEGVREFRTAWDECPDPETSRISTVNVFSVGEKITRVLEDLARVAAADPAFVEVVGRRFRPRVFRGWYDFDENERNIGTWLCAAITLSKPIVGARGRVLELDAGILVDRKRTRFLAHSSPDGLAVADYAVYPGRKLRSGLDVDDFTEFVLANWRAWTRAPARPRRVAKKKSR